MALESVDLTLQVAELREEVGSLRPEALEQDAKLYKDELGEISVEAKKIVDVLQGTAMQRGVQKATSEFIHLRDRFKQRERQWFIAAVLAAGLFLLAVILILTGEPLEEPSVPAITTYIFKRLLALSVPAAFMRIALAKYNAERHLHITYDHRANVQEQYEVFESSIGDDADSKNQLRLEVVRILFSDLSTGYLKADGADVNLSPMVNVVESVTKRG